MIGDLLIVLAGEARLQRASLMALVAMCLSAIGAAPMLLLTLGTDARPDPVGDLIRADTDEVCFAGPEAIDAWIEPEDGLRRIEGTLPTDGVIPRDAVAAEVEPSEGGYTIVWRSDDARSRKAESALYGVLDRWRKAERLEALAALGIPGGPEAMVRLEMVDEADPELAAAVPLAGALPVALFSILLLSGMYTAVEILTAEREHRTLETLLTSRADRRAILLGKALTVFGITYGMACLTLLSLGVFGALGWMDAWVPGPGRLMALALAVAPLAALSSAIFCTVAAYAPDYRTMSLLGSVLMIGLAAPSTVALIPEVGLNGVWMVVPLSNLALLERDLVLGVASPGTALQVGLIATLEAVGCLAVAWHLLQREAMVLGPPSTAARRMRGNYAPDAATLSVVVALLLGFLGLSAQMVDLVAGSAFTQIGVLALPSVVYLRYLGLPVGQTLSLRWPDPRDAALAVMAGCWTWGVGGLVMWAQHPVLPDSADRSMQLNEVLVDFPLPVMLASFALLPAICEELLFRGALLGLLRTRFRGPAVIAITSVLFGLFHIEPWRFAPTGMLGVVMGVAVWRSRSLLTGTLIHLINNSLALLAASAVTQVPDDASPVALVVASALTVLSLAAMGRSGAAQTR